MNITAGILFYLLSKEKNTQHICHSADRTPLNRFEYYRGQPETEKGVLYISAGQEGVLLFCSEKKQKISRILKDPFKVTDEGLGSLWIQADDPKEADERMILSAEKTAEYISRVWNDFSQTQNEILKAVIEQKPVEAVMEKVKDLLREPFIVVDRDMLLIYDHPEVAARMQAELGDNYSDKIIEELLVAKEFHEVARKREPFYYQMQNVSPICYCINIVADGYYYARLVVYLEDDQTQLPSGAEQLAEYVAAVLVQMIRGGFLQMQHSHNDHLHVVITRLLEGASLNAEEIQDAIAGYGWNENQIFQVICLEPYQAAGWNTQIENTMPTITRKLEQNRRHSCAAFSGNQIMWVINHSLSAEQTSSYELTQQMLVMLRENVLKAGASSEFRSISLLGSALKQARAALEIGTRNNPSYWYYRFDDYRLAFMIDAIRGKEIDPLLLVHPAIPLLLKYDQAHDSELSKTFRTLIEKRGNVTQASETLFIHRTTLFRRLNQIRELTGLDLDDTDLMLELSLSYRIMEPDNTV